MSSMEQPCSFPNRASALSFVEDSFICAPSTQISNDCSCGCSPASSVLPSTSIKYRCQVILRIFLAYVSGGTGTFQGGVA